MARPDQEAVDTFMSITGVSEATAILKLEEHRGNLNEAVNAHFTEGDRNITQEVPFSAPSDDVMDIDDSTPVEALRPSSLLFPSARDLNPFSLLDPNYSRSAFLDIVSRSPFVSHPRNVREIPIEVKDGDGASMHPHNAPTIEEVTDTEHDLGRETHGTIIIDDEDDEKEVNTPSIGASRYGKHITSVNVGQSAPTVMDVPNYSNDIEEEMIRAAIEASKQDAKLSNQQHDEHLDLTESNARSRQSFQEDTELEHAVSLSLQVKMQTAEQEKALRELEENAGASEVRAEKHPGMEELGEATSSSARKSQLEAGGSSIQVDAEDVENQPLVRRRRRRVSSVPVETNKDIEKAAASPPSSPQEHNNVNHSQHNGDDFAADVWGGISSEEHDEAVMLEAAMFGGIPEGSGYHFPYAPQLSQNGFDTVVGPYSMHVPRPPSPSLTAQRLLREQQDDEYFASLEADREKELKAKEEAEAALAEEKRKEDNLRSKLLEEQEIARQLAAKEASLPQEPAPDDENAVTLLVRMPDGSRRGRRFLKSDKLQYLFDFIDVSRGIKLGSYRLVRPYPRRAFSDVESTLTLSELGLTSKQEALFLELI
ncbi:plant UBX domain-containing protein 8-like isoform X1 [Primulina huaijiensis]|uniref:plant UBX domain-containing protein 8-like isoform X1 n=1 Tax=Primulina huaijiensis TaxID=1492673 RepID=UPI003CC791D1